MDKKVISVQSLARTTGVSNDFTITDPNEHFINNPKSVKATLICIPYTWYNVNATSGNVFTWTGDITGVHSIVLADNNYTGESFATALQAALELAAPGQNYMVTYDTVTNKFTITSDEATTLDFSVADNMHLILGWPDGTVTGSVMTHTSPNVAGFVLDKSVWVCTDMIRGIDNGVIPWVSDDPPQEYNILAEVPIIGCFNSILVYAPPPELPFYPITNSDFSLVDRTTPRTTRFFLKFPSGGEVDLNGQEWSMQLVLDFNKPVNGLIN